MDESLFDKILRELKDINFSGGVSPFIINEPLLDKRLESFVGKLRSKLPNVFIIIETNGDLLDKVRFNSLLSSGLNTITINCYDNEEQFKKFDALVKKVIKESNEEIIRRPGNSGIEYNRLEGINVVVNRKFKENNDEDIEPLLKRINFTNWAGNINCMLPVELPLKRECWRPFMEMSVNYRGEVILCCADWEFEVIMGDVRKESLLSIWNNNKFRYYRDKLKLKDRNLPLCCRCDFAGGVPNSQDYFKPVCSDKNELKGIEQKGCPVDLQNLTFLGYRRDIHDIKLYFLVKRRMKDDFRIFVHAFPSEASLLPRDRIEHGFINLDHIPRIPTQLWFENRVYVDSIDLSMLDPGHYTLRFGFFNKRGRMNLPGHEGDSVPIYDVEVKKRFTDLYSVI